METCWKERKKRERNVHFGTLNFRIFWAGREGIDEIQSGPITEGESYKVREKQQQSESGQEGQADPSYSCPAGERIGGGLGRPGRDLQLAPSCRLTR